MLSKNILDSFFAINCGTLMTDFNTIFLNTFFPDIKREFLKVSFIKVYCFGQLDFVLGVSDTGVSNRLGFRNRKVVTNSDIF
jgi:hypothetical protein